MKYLLLLLIAIFGFLSTIEAVTEPVCSFRNAEGETVFLKYLPLLRKGQDYVDFDPSGRCLRRATCSDTFKTEIEPCSKYPVTCANKRNYDGVFPACCVKC